MRSLITFAVLSGLSSILGCGNPGATRSVPSQPASPAAVATAPSVPPKFAGVEVSIRDRGGSCTTSFTPLPIVSGREVKHGSTCGHPGTVTKLSWQYLGTTDQGDRYEFERTFPVNESNRTTIKKEVVYTGKELLLFDDEDSTVWLRPAASNEQTVERDRRSTSDLK
jgi:hypothetical protein